MKQLIYRFWFWLCAIFTKQKNSCETTTSTQATDDKKRTKKKPRGKLLWDSMRGTYRRRTYPTGRNQPCPCGAMRQAPQDTTKRMKFKFCCGRNW